MSNRSRLSTLLITVSVTSFMGTFLISSINIALPSIADTFELNSLQLSWIVTAFLLSSAMFLLPAGRWADLTGINKLYKAGLVIFTISIFLSSFAVNGLWLIILRFLQGIGAAFTSTTGQAILVKAFPVNERGKVIGISVSSVYTGLALGPFAGGFLTQYAGWQSIFLISTILGAIATVIAFSNLEKEVVKNELNPHDLNHTGIVVYMIGLIMLVYGSGQIPGIRGWILMLLGIVLLILFWMFEHKSKQPMIDTKLFTKNRLFAFSNIAALINYAATSAIVFFLSLYLQKIRGLEPREAGLILVAQPIMMTLFSPVVGRLSDRVQPRYPASSGMIMCTVGLLAMSFFNQHTPIWIIVSVLLWIGTGFALFSSPNMNTIMSSVDRKSIGLASGTAASMRILGQIISMTIITLFFAAYFHGKQIAMVDNKIFLKVMQLGFLSFTLLCASGIYFSVSRGSLNRTL